MMLNTIKIRNITFLWVFLLSLFIFADEALANKSNLSTVLLTYGYQEVPIQLVQNGRITCPVLIIAGEEDLLIPIKYSKVLADLFIFRPQPGFSAAFIPGMKQQGWKSFIENFGLDSI